MSHKVKKLDDSQVEITITVAVQDYQDDLKKAAQKISNKAKIKGFRKGKASYEVVKKEFGEMAIMQEALETIIKSTYYQAVVEEKFETLGMPQISVEKVAPDNDIVYKATVALMPSFTLPKIDKIKVNVEKKEITEKDINETIDALRGMQAVEVVKTGKAEGKDKLIIDMDMTVDNVPVEGGQAKDYQVYLGEPHYIPGFDKEVVGLKKGETKEFTLDFPKDHYQKHLAGKKVGFKVTVKEVFERQLPELNEDFAKKLGQTTIEGLKAIVKQNMMRESHGKAVQKAEIEILEKLIEATKFKSLPEVLVNSEKQKMFYELKGDIEKNGITIDQYLQDIKKTEQQLFEEFKVQAEKRAKAALISRQIAAENDITIGDEELENELVTLREMYKANPEHVANLDRQDVKDTIATSMQNKKVMKWLSAKILGDQIQNDKDLEHLGCDHDHEHGEECGTKK